MSTRGRGRDGAEEPGTTDLLARRAAGGEEEALARLYVRLAPTLCAYASLRIGWRWIDPEDVIGEVWVRLRSRLEDYRPDRSFRAWVMGFARNVIREAQLDVTRSRRSRIGADLSASRTEGKIPADVSTASQRVGRDEDLRRFVAWVRESLSRYEHEVLILRGLQGLPLKEVAQALDRSERATTVCWGRVREKVRVYGIADQGLGRDLLDGIDEVGEGAA